jgi:hypothetical protein
MTITEVGIICVVIAVFNAYLFAILEIYNGRKP